MDKVLFFLVVTASCYVSKIKSEQVTDCDHQNRNCTDISCEGKTTTLKCNDPDKVVKVVDAKYGRSVSDRCLGLGNDCANTADITHQIANRCHLRTRQCTLTLKYRSLGITDPCRFKSKYYNITFKCCKNCPSLKFGCDCQNTCHCLNNDECNMYNGRCPSVCASGWQGTDCSLVCLDHMFGQNCSKNCNCQAPCNKHTGTCPVGCSSGWLGDTCQEPCPPGKYGDNCTGVCRCHHMSCNNTDGSCMHSCLPGLVGDNCAEECPDGTFGLNCSKDCHCQDVCNKVNGRCPVNCTSGWLGVDCQKECTDGTFGQNCSKDCRCQDVCHKGNGSCPTNCTSGWQGVDCQKECTDGTFGQNCSRDCHCQDVCHKGNGSCTTNCTSGWQGVDCQKECQDGKFGLDCLKDCHCSNTADCDKDTGSCATGCLAGWRGSDCQQPDCSVNDPCGIHTCQEFGRHFNCSCLQGYENSDPIACKDIDECDRGNICGIHTCRNEEGSYECTCRNTSYEKMSPQICVEVMKFDVKEIEQSLFPKEIQVLLAVAALSTNIIVFFAVVMFKCAQTVVCSMYRYITTKPKGEVDVAFVKFSTFQGVVISSRPPTESTSYDISVEGTSV